MITPTDTPVVNEYTENEDLRIAIDPIHGGLRAAVFGSFVAGGIIGFGATAVLAPNLLLLSFLMGGAAAAGTSFSLEKYLKDKWPSGRELVANKERIALSKHGKIEAVVDAQQQVNVVLWHFTVKKEGPRAKKGWKMIAMALEQEDSHVVVYSTVDPDTFEEMPLSSQFTRLERKKKDKKKEKNTLSSASRMRRAGEQRRLHEAEIIRQLMGGDMFYDDFVTLLTYMQTHYSKWMIVE